MSFWQNPEIKRPLFDASLPGLRVKRQPIIRGAMQTRCVFCGSSLHIKEDICPTCGSTQISLNASQNGKSIKESPIWRKKYREYGNPKNGYE